MNYTERAAEARAHHGPSLAWQLALNGLAHDTRMCRRIAERTIDSRRYGQAAVGTAAANTPEPYRHIAYGFRLTNGVWEHFGPR